MVKELEMNPYVIQIEKFVNSLGKLSRVFLELEKKKSVFTEEEFTDMCERICNKTCLKCSNQQECFEKSRLEIYDMIREIFSTVEEYGVELNVEIKRKIQKNCGQAPKFLRNALEVYRDEKQNMIWNQKIAQNREGCVDQLESFGQMIKHATKELDSSIFADDFLEKRLKSEFDDYKEKNYNEPYHYNFVLFFSCCTCFWIRELF